MNYNQRFEEAIKKLNPAQRRAVETTEGPVLVIAGPGTGKTQILTTRIGHILNTQDISPENILCLTFTNAGRSAMKKRLVDLIGPTGDLVEVHTFHSFCLKVIQEKPESFPDFDGENMSELEIYELILDLVNTIPKENILKQDLKNADNLVRKFIDLFKLMSTEQLSPEFITSKIEAFEYQIMNNPENIAKSGPRKGKITKKVLEKLEGIDKTLEAVKFYDNYKKLKQKKLKYDFNDMISGVIDVFEKNKDLVLDYQEKFQYILVDEFQDTNGSQAKIIELLSDYENPNIFIVGDDDQAVYEFQGAKIENFHKFKNKYANKIEYIVLTENYRSVPKVLEYANRLVGNNEIRLVNDKALQLDKNITAAHPLLKKETIEPVAVECVSKSHEKAFIIETIKKLQSEGVSYSEMAIIYTTNWIGKEFMKALTEFGIPYQAKNDINILEDDLFLIFKKLLKYVDDEKQRPENADWAIFDLLHAPFFDISHREIEKIAIYRLTNTVTKGEDKIRPTWKSICRNIDVVESLTDDSKMKIKAFIELTDELISDHINLKITRFIEEIYFKSGVFSYIAKHKNRFDYVEMFNTFKKFVATEFEKNPKIKLDEILMMLDKMKALGYELKITRNLGTEGVNLITAHGSKGLEFEAVFIPYTNAHIWESKRQNNSNPKFKFPNNLVDAREDDNNETLRRLMYVATTRAQKHLYFTYTYFEKLIRSKLLTELIGSENTILKVNSAETGNIDIDRDAAFEIEKLDLIAQPILEENMELSLQSIVDKFVLSPTSMNSYIKCPVSFYFQNILKVDTEPSEYLMYGSAMHYALEHFHRKMLNSNPKKFGTESFLLELYAKKWSEYEYQLDDTKFETKLNFGKNGLSRFYKDKINNLTTEVEIEKSYNYTNDSGTVFYGKLDKVENNHGFLKIVDYKTGDYRSGKFTKTLEPNDKGESFKQACFYTYLIYKVTGRLPNSVSFQFLDKQKESEGSFEKNVEINVETLTEFEILADSVFAKIKNKEFYKGCGNVKCTWCNFTKTNNIAIDYKYGNTDDADED
jgi:DNA helicase II / ATP-dependent DNA helicase PcrA